MNVDALPLDVLLWLGLGAWGLLALVILYERQRDRAHDAHARVAARDVLTQRVQHSEADHEVEGEQPEHGAGQPANDNQDVHAHSVPIYLPPGIPSVTERLDRWTELS